MKSFIRLSVTLGLVGSSIMTFWLGPTLNVLALTPEEIVEKLNQIPVYTIGNNKEILLSGNKDGRAFITYLSHQDAQQAVEKITKKNPEHQVKVIVLPLGKVYELLKNRQEIKSKEPPYAFTFIPLEKQLSSAISIHKRENPNDDDFEGIPLFYGTVIVNKQKTFLSVQSEKKSITPFFFERESLQRLIEDIRQQRPEFASSIEVSVVALSDVLGVLERDDEKQEEFVKSVVLIPSREGAKKLLEIREQSRQAEQE